VAEQQRLPEGLCHLFQMERKGAVADLQIATVETLTQIRDDGANGGVRKQIEKLTAVRAETWTSVASPRQSDFCPKRHDRAPTGRAAIAKSRTRISAAK
jgi:hypothetical protein